MNYHIDAPNHRIFFAGDSKILAAAMPRGEAYTTQNGVLWCTPFDLRTVYEAARLGLQIPNPIHHYYRWPGPYPEPFDVQRQTADFMTRNPRGYILNDIGTGKTAAAVWGVDFLRRQGFIRKCLIISPLSTLARVWYDHLYQCNPSHSIAVLHGAKQKRLKLLAQDHDYYVINHDGVKVIAEEIAETPDIDAIVIDEVAVLRNKQTDLWKATNYVVNGQIVTKRGTKQVHQPKTWVWGMTGTPTPQAPTDAYGQIKLLTPQRAPKYFTDFRKATQIQLSEYTWVPKPEAPEVVYAYMQPAIRFSREDSVDIPPCMTAVREAELSAEQKRAYKSMAKKLIMEYHAGIITAANAGVKTLKLAQIAAGVVYDENGGHNQLDASPRLRALMEILDEAAPHTKVIVYAPLTGALNMLVREISKKWTCDYVDGSVSASARNTIFYNFQHNQDPRVLIAHPRTMAHGLTLTAASVIVWYLPTSSETYQQANGRIQRPSQESKQLIIHLQSSAIERKMYTNLANNARLQDGLLAMYETSDL